MEEFNSDHIYRTKVIYTIKDIAKILQIGVDEVFEFIKEGHIKGFRLKDGKRSPGE